jgi:hypothetical protein
MYGIGWISTAHDGIANERERLRQCALDGTHFRFCWDRDDH